MEKKKLKDKLVKPMLTILTRGDRQKSVLFVCKIGPVDPLMGGPGDVNSICSDPGVECSVKKNGPILKAPLKFKPHPRLGSAPAKAP